MRFLATLFVFGLAVDFCFSAEVKFPLTKDNTKISFVGTKKDGKHEGGFKTVTGSATIDGKNPTTLKLNVDIDMNSTYTDNDKLTGHLKSPDFFGVKTNPKAKFVSSKVVKADGGYNVTGDLRLAGKTRKITFPAKIEATGDSLTLSSTFKIDRHDWGVSFGKDKIDKLVTLTVKVTAKK
jgi:polyisoprenoid-binding protein YceI